MIQSALFLAVLCCYAVSVKGFNQYPFNCRITCNVDNYRQTSVHKLTPCDIEVIGAIGDDDTAATFVNNVNQDDYGFSFVTGSSYDTVRSEISLANILLKYNPDLKGYSRGPSHPGFNVAFGSALSSDAPLQAQKLVRRMKHHLHRDTFHKGWKMVNIFIGNTDACISCTNSSVNAQNYKNNIQSTLDYLQQHLKRVVVNLMLIPNFAQYLSLQLPKCPNLLFSCPCAFGRSVPRFDQFVNNVNTALQDLVDSGRYSKSKEFAVVIQPFFKLQTLPPLKPDATVDQSYFKSDCRHFSPKGYEALASELWNNILQPGGKKSTKFSVYTKEFLVCPPHNQKFIPTK